MQDPRFNFQKKKSLHISLRRETHGRFRTQLFKMGLSMQESLEEFAELVGSENPRALRILEELLERKRNKAVSQLSESDADEIYALLEQEGPLSQAVGSDFGH